MYGKVSIIMPNYNCEKFLDETIISVLNQTYQNWELLVVDDCSSDNSVKIIKSYIDRDDRIKLFINETNSGAAASRNWAMREATGKWIAFLDSDDLWLPEKLEKQLAFMEQHNYGFTFTKYGQIDKDSNKIGIIITGPKRIKKRKIRYCCCYLGCLTVMYNVEKVGLIQIDESIRKRNDDAIWLKVGKFEDAYYLDELLALYRIRKESISHQSRLSLIKYHYRIYRIGEGFVGLKAFYYTVKNLTRVCWKKFKYVKKG